MRHLLTVMLLATFAPAQSTASMERVSNPLTRQPTDILVDLDRSGVFWNVTPTGDLEALWPGDSSRLWLQRESPLFRPAGAQALGIDVIDAAYILPAGAPPTGAIRVINEIDCGHFTTSLAVPMPGLPQAFRIAPNRLPGWFGVNSCAGPSNDSLKVYACEWSEVGTAAAPTWSYVRLRFQW